MARSLRRTFWPGPTWIFRAARVSTCERSPRRLSMGCWTGRRCALLTPARPSGVCNRSRASARSPPNWSWSAARTPPTRCPATNDGWTPRSPNGTGPAAPSPKSRRRGGPTAPGLPCTCVRCVSSAPVRSPGAKPARPAVSLLAWCAVALSLDVGQAFGDVAVSDPDDVHAPHVPLAPVVAPAHHGALGAVGELFLDGEPGLRRAGQQVSPDLRYGRAALVAGAIGGRRGGLKHDVIRHQRQDGIEVVRIDSGGEAVHQTEDRLRCMHVVILSAVARRSQEAGRRRRAGLGSAARSRLAGIALTAR